MGVLTPQITVDGLLTLAHVNGIALHSQLELRQRSRLWARDNRAVDSVETPVVAGAQNELPGLVPFYDATQVRADGRESLQPSLSRVDHDDWFVVDRHHHPLTGRKVNDCTYLHPAAPPSRCPLGRPQITDNGSEHPPQRGHDRGDAQDGHEQPVGEADQATEEDGGGDGQHRTAAEEADYLLVGEHLWQYRVWPIHDGHTSVLNFIIWPVYGFYLYFFHHVLQHMAISIRPRWLKGLLSGFDGPLLEILANGFFLLFYGTFYFYYLPDDLRHYTSIQVVPLYMIMGICLALIIEYMQERPRRWHYPAGFYFGGVGFVLAG